MCSRRARGRVYSPTVDVVQGCLFSPNTARNFFSSAQPIRGGCDPGSAEVHLHLWGPRIHSSTSSLPVLTRPSIDPALASALLPPSLDIVLLISRTRLNEGFGGRHLPGLAYACAMTHPIPEG